MSNKITMAHSLLIKNLTKKKLTKKNLKKNIKNIYNRSTQDIISMKNNKKIKKRYKYLVY